MVARSAHVPVIEPSDSQEAKDFMKVAYEISEKYDTPVIFRTTTKLAHSQSVVELYEREEIADKEYSRNTAKYVMMPASAIGRHLVVEERENRLAKDAASLSINKIEMGDTKIGFITSGIAYQYVKEACPEASVLKLGLVNPISKELIADFCSRVEKVYIFEELEPVIEEQVRAWGFDVCGKRYLHVRVNTVQIFLSALFTEMTIAYLIKRMRLRAHLFSAPAVHTEAFILCLTS